MASSNKTNKKSIEKISKINSKIASHSFKNFDTIKKFEITRINYKKWEIKNI